LSAHESLVDRKLPPVTEVGALAMVAVAVGVIFNAAYLPKHAQLLLSRIRDFAWARFRQVAGWALGAYVVIAGMIEYAFLYDHTHGTQLVILTLLLALFMLNVPVLIAFTVARYHRV
jgi:hypothetical protein